MTGFSLSVFAVNRVLGLPSSKMPLTGFKGLLFSFSFLPLVSSFDWYKCAQDGLIC